MDACNRTGSKPPIAMSRQLDRERRGVSEHLAVESTTSHMQNVHSASPLQPLQTQQVGRPSKQGPEGEHTGGGPLSPRATQIIQHKPNLVLLHSQSAVQVTEIARQDHPGFQDPRARAAGPLITPRQHQTRVQSPQPCQQSPLGLHRMTLTGGSSTAVSAQRQGEAQAPTTHRLLSQPNLATERSGTRTDPSSPRTGTTPRQLADPNAIAWPGLVTGKSLAEIIAASPMPHMHSSLGKAEATDFPAFAAAKSEQPPSRQEGLPEQTGHKEPARTTTPGARHSMVPLKASLTPQHARDSSERRGYVSKVGDSPGLLARPRVEGYPPASNARACSPRASLRTQLVPPGSPIVDARGVQASTALCGATMLVPPGSSAVPTSQPIAASMSSMGGVAGSKDTHEFTVYVPPPPSVNAASGPAPCSPTLVSRASLRRGAADAPASRPCAGQTGSSQEQAPTGQEKIRTPSQTRRRFAV